MDTLARLLLVGFSHRSAPVAIRERFAVRPEEAALCLRSLVAGETIEEAFLLSTCNRTEVLVLARGGRDPLEEVCERAFLGLAEKFLYVYRGTHAIIHLFRVAGGLDSLVLGESEILGQVKRAHDAALAAGTAGRVLGALLPQAVRVGKRVRSETELGQGTLSVARVGLDIAHQAFGSFEGCRALIVGAGETGLSVARHLQAAGVGRVDFANRTRSRAEEAACELRGGAYTLEELAGAIVACDLVVACVDGSPALVRPEHFDAKRLKLRDRPLVVLDLSVPRAVEPGVRRLSGVLAYDLDDLEPVVAQHRRGRDDSTGLSAEILVAELHKFLALWIYGTFSPAIARLRERFEEERDRTLDAVAGARAQAREVQLAHELSRRLLDVALDQMKEGARRARSEKALDAEYQRFMENL